MPWGVETQLEEPVAHGSETRVLTLKKGTRWRRVYSEDFAEAGIYEGLCTHEDCAFLVDPFKLLIDWEKWAAEELPNQIIEQYERQGAAPLKLKVYVGLEPILFGLTEYPAVRVESWHHGSPGIILVIAAIIGLIIVVWVFFAWLFQKAEEIPWVVPLAAGGLLLLLLLILSWLRRRD